MTTEKNLQTDAPVEIRLQGKVYQGKAGIIQDDEKLIQILQSLRDVRGEEYMRRMGFLVDNPQVTRAEILAATQGTKFIEIELSE